MRTLKEMVVNKQKVTFRYYRDGELWYATECGFEFPVPINDTGTGIFRAEDRAIRFMRWLRRQIQVIEEARVEQRRVQASGGAAESVDPV